MTSKINKNNKLINLNDVKNIFKKINLDVEPKNINYYIRAMTHKSYTGTNLFTIDDSIVQLQLLHNELYEFVGDSIINKVVCIYLYNRYKNFETVDEGKLTKLKQRIISSKSLSEMARYLELQKFCLISLFMDKNIGRNTDKLMEDSFEAFVYAIYEDLGESITERFIINTMEQVIDFSEINNEDINHKHILLEYYQKRWKLTPSYEKISEIGTPYSKTYKMGVLDFFGNIIGTGIGSTKKDAEQEASREALIFLKNLFFKENKEIIQNFIITEIDYMDYIINKKLISIFNSILQKNKIFKIEFTVNNLQKEFIINVIKDKYKIYNQFLNIYAIDYLNRYYNI